MKVIQMSPAALLENIVPASAFNQGKSARCFEKVADDAPVIVMKNNAPYRVVITVGDFTRLTELEEDNELLSIALARLEKHAGEPGIPAEEVYRKAGINIDELEPLDDSEFE